MEKLIALVPTAARLLLGLVFFVFGLNGFLGFLPMPPMTEQGGAFMGALAVTGYMFPLIKGTEVLAGAMLLSGRFVPLSLVLLAPITVNILAFHAFLDAPSSVGMPLFLIALQVGLAWFHRKSFAGVLAAKAEPELPSVPEVQQPLSV